MPYKKSQSRKEKLPDYVSTYLSDDQSADGNNFELWSLRHGQRGFDGTSHPRELWEKHRTEFLPKFIREHPGRRPLPWWQWQSPGPRLKISGKGELPKNVVMFLAYGVPQHWDVSTLDPSDPLVFESQATYLLRLDLLAEPEKKYVEKHPELLEAEKFQPIGTENIPGVGLVTMGMKGEKNGC